ncbi:uncharacterized protein [Littorina saxatilis]|uniref:THD domain-containing protein n=1 Tax=Littorina saxatilis TaxID=31220 RepID=A0AAN9ANX9_9CAEN
MASQSQSEYLMAAPQISEDGGETESGININFDNPEERLQKTTIKRFSGCHKLFLLFIGLLVVANFVVIGVSINAIITRGVEEEGRGGEKDGGGKEGCGHHGAVVAPLCVPCEEGMEGEGEGGWRRYTEEGGQDMCCPLDHGLVASAVHQIYETVRKIKEIDILQQPPQPYSPFFSEPTTSDETLLFANRYKPSGHMTGVQRFDATRYYESSTKCANETQIIGDWPLRVEPYRSMTAGYVQRLSWGLMVPASGLYRVHTSVNFYFSYPQQRKDNEKRKAIPVVHQIARYRARDGSTTVLADRNHTIDSTHCDGLTSFLVAVADLEIGDVISVNVSHESAMAMQDRWHTEGLFLIQ